MENTKLNDHSARDHALLSASSAHRWLACPPSAVAAELYVNEATDYAAEGTLAHEVAEQIASGHKVEPDPERGIDREMIECAEGYRDFIEEQKTSDSAVVLLEQRIDFSNWVPGGFGTADCCILQDKHLTVIDFKYGMGVPVYATGNPQMKLYALGAVDLFADIYDIEKVTVVIYQPRLENVSVDTFDLVDLLDWGSNVVKPTAEQAAKGKGKYTPGEHCRFCPHAGRCRALGKLCTETVKALNGKNVKVECLAPHEIADILAIESLLTMAIKKVRSYALDTMLSGGDIPGFKVVEGRLGNRKWTSELMAAKAFEEAGYSREEITETKLLSPSQLEKALGKKRVADLMEQFTHREAGAPTIASESDKRPAYNRLEAAIKDFD